MAGSVDSALARLGNPGRFHIMAYICLGANNIVVVLNHLAMVVFAPRTEHECAATGALLNQTNSTLHVTADQCSLHVNETSDSDAGWHTTDLDCPGPWDYPMQQHEYNIIMQFDLVCDRKYLTYLATTVYFCGVMLGGLVFGTLSDMYGRKPILLLTLYTQIGIGVWTAFTNHFIIFIFLRFIQGFLMQGLQTTSLVLIMEMFPREYSTMAGSMFEVFWAIGVMWLALLGFALQNWRYIQLAIVIPNVLTIFYICCSNVEDAATLHKKEMQKAAEDARAEYLRDHPDAECTELKHDPLKLISGTNGVVYDRYYYDDDDDDDEEEEEEEDQEYEEYLEQHSDYSDEELLEDDVT